MLCEKYENLTIPERIEKIGRVVHCLQNDDECFDYIECLIRMAEQKGVFSGVVINPKTNRNDYSIYTD